MTSAVAALREAWRTRWPDALGAWSKLARLSEPRWCTTRREEGENGLTGSFAMYRLLDRAVVVSVRQVRSLGLEAFPVEVLAHEIGHHVYVPADLADKARILARIRRGLPGKEGLAALVSNLWSDLLINDRLQRSARLDMAGVYRALRSPTVEGAFAVYLRAYERLWSLPTGDLVGRRLTDEEDLDASFLADLARTHAADPIRGAGPFAAVLYAHLPDAVPGRLPSFVDFGGEDEGDEAPGGLVELGEGDDEEPRHPGEVEDPDERVPLEAAPAAGREAASGRKARFRDPSAWTELMKSVGVRLSDADLVVQYYRELARSFSIRFPPVLAPDATDTIPEGLVPWEPGSSTSRIDWPATLARSPVVIPGLTTVEREDAPDSPSTPGARPPDLYVGVDCSGSMFDPAKVVSYPVLAAVVLAKAALAAGARVMATLSGEPGRYASTNGFVRHEHEVLTVLTSYLGTGYAFGAERLRETFVTKPTFRPPVRLFLVTDSDFFTMLGATTGGWELASEVVSAAGGGAVAALDRSTGPSHRGQIARLAACGWQVRPVSTAEDLVALARAVGRDLYAPASRRRVPS